MLATATGTTVSCSLVRQYEPVLSLSLMSIPVRVPDIGKGVLLKS
jgi:hypothetical protein